MAKLTLEFQGTAASVLEAIGKIDLNLKKLEESIGKTAKRFEQADAQIGQGLRKSAGASKGFAVEVGQSLESMGKGAIKATLAITALTLAFSAREAVAFQTNIANVSTLLEKGAPAIKEFEQGLLKIGERSVKSATDLSRGLYQALSAGIPATLGAGGALDLLDQAQKAATAGLSTTEEAVLSLTRVINAYGPSVGTAAQISDKLFRVVKDGIVEFPDLAKGFGEVVAVASQFGVTFDETAASVARISQVLPKEATFTAAKNLFLKLSGATFESADAARKLGVRLDETTLKTRGLIPVLVDLVQKSGGNKQVLLKILGDADAVKAALLLASDGGVKFSEQLERIKNAAGETDEALKKQQATVASAAAGFKNAIDEQVIKAFNEQGGELANTIGGLAKSIREVDTKSFTEGLSGILTVLGGIARALIAIVEAAGFASNALEATSRKGRFAVDRAGNVKDKSLIGSYLAPGAGIIPATGRGLGGTVIDAIAGEGIPSDAREKLTGSNRRNQFPGAIVPKGLTAENPADVFKEREKELDKEAKAELERQKAEKRAIALLDDKALERTKKRLDAEVAAAKAALAVKLDLYKEEDALGQSTQEEELARREDVLAAINAVAEVERKAARATIRDGQEKLAKLAEINQQEIKQVGDLAQAKLEREKKSNEDRLKTAEEFVKKRQERVDAQEAKRQDVYNSSRSILGAASRETLAGQVESQAGSFAQGGLLGSIGAALPGQVGGMLAQAIAQLGVAGTLNAAGGTNVGLGLGKIGRGEEGGVGQALIGAAELAGAKFIGLVEEAASFLYDQFADLVSLSANTDVAHFQLALATKFGEAGKLIDHLVMNLPVLLDQLPGFIEKLSQQLVEAMPQVARSLAAGMPGVVRALAMQLGPLADALIAAIPDLVAAVVDSLPILIEKLTNGLISKLPAFFVVFSKELAVQLAAKLPEMVAAFVKGIVDGLSGLFDFFGGETPAQSEAAATATRALPVNAGGEADTGFYTGIGTPLYRAGTRSEVEEWIKQMGLDPNSIRHFATGGTTREDGPGYLHRGEGILRQLSTMNLGGKSAIDALNRSPNLSRAIGQMLNSASMRSAFDAGSIVPSASALAGLTGRGANTLPTAGGAAAGGVHVSVGIRPGADRELSELIGRFLVVEANRAGARVSNVRDIVTQTVRNMPRALDPLEPNISAQV